MRWELSFPFIHKSIFVRSFMSQKAMTHPSTRCREQAELGDWVAVFIRIVTTLSHTFRASELLAETSPAHDQRLPITYSGSGPDIKSM